MTTTPTTSDRLPVTTSQDDGSRYRPAVQARLARHERQAPLLVARAAAAHVDVRYLGIAPLFKQPRAYAGTASDWIVGPESQAGNSPLPDNVRSSLARLVEAGIDFPLVYVAHEIPKDKLNLPATREPVQLESSEARHLIGPVPAAESSVAGAQQLGTRSEAILRVLGKASLVAGAVIATPIIVTAAAAGALLSGLDPIVLGVMPAGAAREGEPGVWYELVRWVW